MSPRDVENILKEHVTGSGFSERYHSDVNDCIRELRSIFKRFRRNGYPRGIPARPIFLRKPLSWFVCHVNWLETTVEVLVIDLTGCDSSHYFGNLWWKWRNERSIGQKSLGCLFPRKFLILCRKRAAHVPYTKWKLKSSSIRIWSQKLGRARQS